MKKSALILTITFSVMMQAHSQLIRVTYHQQEKSWYCGAAAAQMVLHFAGLPYRSTACTALTDSENCDQAFGLCQSCLYKNNRVTMSQDRAWYSFPDALLNTLNTYLRRSDSSNFVYKLFDPTDESILGQKILYTLKKYRMPAVVPVFTNNHWVVVTGADSPNEDPGDLDLNTTTGYWLHNPYPQLPSDVSNIHSDPDTCGHPDLADYQGLVNVHVSKEVWFDQYIQPITSGDWSSKFLAITDTDDVNIVPIAVSRRKPKNTTGFLITAKKAAKYALEAIKEEGLLKHKELSVSLSDVTAGIPMQVQATSHLRDYYFIVPILDKENRTIALINIDGITGNYQQSAFARPGGNLNGFSKRPNDKEIISIIQSKYHIVEGNVDSLASTNTVEKIMVWVPNETSYSPFYPYFRFNYGANSFFLRLNSKEVVHNLYTPSKEIMLR